MLGTSEDWKAIKRSGKEVCAGPTHAVAKHGCAKAAEAVGVVRQTVYTWKALLAEVGFDALPAVSDPGVPHGFPIAVGASPCRLLQSSTEHGFGAEFWTPQARWQGLYRLTGVRVGQTPVRAS